MRAITPLPALAFLLAMTAGAGAVCPDREAIAKTAANWLAKVPGKALALDSMDDAVCARDRLIDTLVPQLGPVAGYKAGLTSKAVQERFGTDAPIAGVLLKSMIIEEGTSVPARFGAVPVWEADMLLVVRDEGINQAKTPEEALAHISGVRPFIELPDLVLAKGEKVDGLQLVAINAGARLGVAGAEVPLPATEDSVKALADVRVVTTNAEGTTVATAPGAVVLGNPLNVVLWLATELKKEGRALKAGDLISVGSFSPLTPPKPGEAFTVRYEGLPGTPKVAVRFTD